MKPITKRQIRIAGIYSLLGVALLVAIAIEADPPPLVMWLVFAMSFVVLEFNAVEVNDRMLQSPGLMVLVTAGAYFAIRPNSSGVFAMAAMAALGPLVPDDFRLRRWFQPLANFGQMVVAASAAGFLLDRLLGSVSVLNPYALLLVAMAGSLASLAYTAIQLTMIRTAVRSVYGVRNLLPWSGTHFLFSSQVVMGMVGGLLGVALYIVEKPAVIVLILVVYLIGHLSLSSYSQLREAHQAALRGFVKVLEARDMYTRGHTERVAYFSQLIGEELRFTGTQLERLRWASLIHDLGKLAIPGELLGKRGAVTAAERSRMREAARQVDGIMAEVDFLRPMVGLSGVHYSDVEEFDPNTWSLDASIVAVADSFDVMTSTRSYRMALNQTDALTELRADETGRFFPDVVDALERGLARTGEVYGGSLMHSAEPVERVELAHG